MSSILFHEHIIPTQSLRRVWFISLTHVAGYFIVNLRLDWWVKKHVLELAKI